MKQRYVDFNGILKFANVIVAMLIVYAWSYAGPHPFLDENSFRLGLALCVQTHLALWIERRHRDPFVVLLAFWMIVYFELRVFSLTMLPSSAVFERFDYDPGDTDYALVFILCANLFLYGGFFAARLGKGFAIEDSGWRAVSSIRVVLVLLMSLALTYLSGSYFSEGNVPRGLNFLVLYFAPTVLMTMALAYFLLFRHSLGRLTILTIVGLIVIELVAHTLLGSRGALIAFVQMVVVVIIGMRGRIVVSRRLMATGVLLAPLLAAVAVAAFVVSTYIRTTRMTEGVGLDVGIEQASRYREKLDESAAADLILAGVANRVGYLDFSAEIIAHREQYSPVLNLPVYGRSIVDNVLTPGIDFYDQPKIANSLAFIYNQRGTPSKQLASDEYQSDQLGIYGEFYALFGWTALPILFAVAFLLKRLLVSIRGRNPFTVVIGRVVVLYGFTRLIDSFGMDWLISEMLPMVAAIFIYGFFFPARRRRPATHVLGTRQLLEGVDATPRNDSP